jgi:hypothetical protein
MKHQIRGGGCGQDLATGGQIMKDDVFLSTLGVAWPNLSTISWHLVVAFIVFVRLVLPEKG